MQALGLWLEGRWCIEDGVAGRHILPVLALYFLLSLDSTLMASVEKYFLTHGRISRGLESFHQPLSCILDAPAAPRIPYSFQQWSKNSALVDHSRLEIHEAARRG